MSRLALTALLVACTSPPPPGRPGPNGGELYADLNEDGTLALTMRMLDVFTNPGGPALPYMLSADESAQVTFRGQTVELLANHDAQNTFGYYGSMKPESPVLPDEPLVLTLALEVGDVTASVTAPPDFALQAPTTSPPPVTLTWSPTASDLMQWTARSTCVIPANGAIPTDTGRIDFPPGVLAPAQPTDACGVEMYVYRTRFQAERTSSVFDTVAFNRWHHAAFEVTP